MILSGHRGISLDGLVSLLHCRAPCLNTTKIPNVTDPNSWSKCSRPYLLFWAQYFARIFGRNLSLNIGQTNSTRGFWNVDDPCCHVFCIGDVAEISGFRTVFSVSVYFHSVTSFLYFPNQDTTGQREHETVLGSAINSCNLPFRRRFSI